MTEPADFLITNIHSVNFKCPNTASKAGFLASLGAELVFIQAASGEYLAFYWQGALLYGLKDELVIGSILSNTICPVEKSIYLAQIQEIIELGIPQNCHYTFKYKQDYFDFDLVISPILQSDGNNQAIIAIGRQTTTPSTPVLAKESTSKRLAKITQNIRRTMDIETIWQQTVNGLGEVLALSKCMICSYKPLINQVQVEAEYCPSSILPSILGQQIYLGDQPEFQQVLETLEPIILRQYSPKLYSLPSLLIIPTFYQDQANGLICLQPAINNFTHRQYQQWWSQKEIELLRELGDQVGTAIAHATLYKELEIAHEQAEAASRLKSEFLANTSHELRTPLNGMIGFLKLILEGMTDNPEEEREFIQEAHRSALHLLNIINDILDIAKIEAGKMKLALAPITLEELFADVEEFTSNLAHQKNLNFSTEMPSTYDKLIIYGNYQRLLQVMLNLVGNAIKFTHEGGVTISAEVIKKKIEFDHQQFPGMLKIRVADTGIGVSLDKQDKLFQSFNQVDGTHTRQYGGTGLGLTISQKLVETMGGIVNFYSMGEGLGSTVTFTIPLYQEPLIIRS